MCLFIYMMIIFIRFVWIEQETRITSFCKLWFIFYCFFCSDWDPSSILMPEIQRYRWSINKYLIMIMLARKYVTICRPMWGETCSESNAEKSILFVEFKVMWIETIHYNFKLNCNHYFYRIELPVWDCLNNVNFNIKTLNIRFMGPSFVRSTECLNAVKTNA